MKAKEKNDLYTPRRSSRIAKAKNTSTKNSSRRKKASKNLGAGTHFTKREKTLIKNLNQWICNGIERERKGEPLFPTGKSQRSPLAVTAKICEISRFSVDKPLPRRKQLKTCKSRKFVVDKKQSYWTVLIISLYKEESY